VTRDQKRADVTYLDNSSRQQVQYWTDDTIGHPLCESNLHRDTLQYLQNKKEGEYTAKLASARRARSVVLGHRVIVFWACAFTSLGEYGLQTIKCLNAAASFLKVNVRDAATRGPRDDGLSPGAVAARFRFSLRAKLQAAILRGNALLALCVGL
jgi:hypothetical protein